MEPVQIPYEESLQPSVTDKGPFREALLEAEEMINRARQHVIVAGVELLRYGMHRLLPELVEKTNIPVTSTLMGKSAFNWRFPLCARLFWSATGPFK